MIARSKEGWCYYIRLGSAQVNVLLAEGGRCPLRTDPAETVENELLSLPSCLLPLGSRE